MTTALEIANDAILSIGLPAVDTLVGGSVEGQRLLVHMNRGGQALMSKRGPWGQGWPSANKTYVFNTIAEQAFYPLPADFVSMVPDTVWDVTDGWIAVGPVTPLEDNVLRLGRAGASVATTLYRQHEVNGQRGLTIYPTPGSADQRISLEYISSSWVRSDVGQPPTHDRVVRDSDVPVFPPHLVTLDVAWRYSKSLGKDADLLLGEFELERDRQFGQALPGRTITLNSPTSVDMAEFASNPVIVGSG